MGWMALVVGLVAAALYVVPELQLASPIVAVAASLIPYASIAWMISAVVFATRRRLWSTLIGAFAVAGLVSQLVWASPYWPGARDDQGSLSLLTLNLRCKTIGLQELTEQVTQIRPELVVLQGATVESSESLKQLGLQNTYTISTFHPKQDNPACGSMVFSMVDAVPLTDPFAPQPVIRVSLEPRPLLLFPVDIPTPRNNLSEWLNGFEILRDALSSYASSPTVAVGDFNAVREHEPMRRLLRVTGLRDAREDAGAGWLPTFPATGHLPSIVALDHVLVSPDIMSTSVTAVQVGENTHLALVAVFQLPTEQRGR